MVAVANSRLWSAPRTPTLIGHHLKPGTAPMPPCCRPVPSQVILLLAMPQVGQDADGEGVGEGSAEARAAFRSARCLRAGADLGQMLEAQRAAMLWGEQQGLGEAESGCHGGRVHV